MKILKMYRLVGTLLLFAGMVNAGTSASGAITTLPKTRTTANAVPAVNLKFMLDKDTPLNVILLDKCWSNRETLDNQKIIADYLMIQPKIPNDFEAAWKTARLVYFIGNYGAGEKRFVNTDEGITLFNYGTEAGLLASKLNPKAVEGYYWYAVNLRSWGLAKGIIAATFHATDGMSALEKAVAINPSYQWYGSSRSLGRYYQELPGLFSGSSAKALALISLAVNKAPEFRNNWVYLGQFYISAGQYDKALEACNRAVNTPAVDGKYEETRYLKEARQCILKAKANQE